jgi:hypothetical protein
VRTILHKERETVNKVVYGIPKGVNKTTGCVTDKVYINKAAFGDQPAPDSIEMSLGGDTLSVKPSVDVPTTADK